MYKKKWMNIILIVFTIATIFFGLWGWHAKSLVLGINMGDIIYRSINALFLSGLFETSENWKHDWRVELSRWFGLATFVLGAFKAIMFLMASSLQTFKAKRLKNHFILIGNNPFASAIANQITLKEKSVNWLTGQENFTPENNKFMYIVEGRWHLSIAIEYGLLHAAKVVIATEDDANTIAIARQIREKIPSQDKLMIFVTINDPWVAMSIDDIKGVTGIRLFSSTQTAARQAHRRHPPFLIAKNHHQARLHALIIGFNQDGEAILLDLLLYCLTTYLGRPKVTIIDDNAENLKAQLNLRYPEIEKSVDLTLIQGSLQGHHTNLTEETFIKLSAKHTFTNAYVCLTGDSVNLSTALELRAITLRYNLIKGPIFTRLLTENALPKIEAGVNHIQSGQLLAYGSLNELVKETGILDDEIDGLARKMHDAYLAASNGEKDANKPWIELSEDKRESNRRLISHIPAKLSSSGIDIEPLIKQLDQYPDIKHLPHIPEFANTDEIVEQLAALEHERWMADRRINGWRQTTTTRNDELKLHTDLVPFDELNEKSKNFDRLMIKTLKKHLTRTI